MADSLEKAVIPLLEAGWEQGWLAIRQTMQFDEAGLPDEIKARLRSLEKRTKPKTLVGRVKAIVLNGHAAGVDYADGEDVSIGDERAERVARELGESVAVDAEALATLLPLVVSNNQGRQWMFGSGLATGTSSIDGCWAALVPVDALLEWCEEGGPERWAHVAPLLPAFAPGGDEAGLRWSEAVLILLERAPRPIDVAASLVDLIRPMSWSGSRAEAIKQRLPLLDALASMLGPEHAEHIAAWRSQIAKTIEREARRELEEHRANNERFE